MTVKFSEEDTAVGLPLVILAICIQPILEFCSNVPGTLLNLNAEIVPCPLEWLANI